MFINIEIKRQDMRVSSLLLCGFQDQTQVIRLDGKYLTHWALSQSLVTE